jgi:predicted permease
MSGLLRNLRYAVRVLARSPGFSLTVVITLALGIGANTAVFSVIDAILLRPLPFPQADRLVRIAESNEKFGDTPASMPRLLDWNRLNSTFEAITGYYVADGSDTRQEFPQRTQYGVVGPHFFEVLGVKPALGRTFNEAEHRVGGPTAVVLSDGFWRTSFRGDPGVVGTNVNVKDVGGDMSFDVTGVLPASFQFHDRAVSSWSPAPIDAPWTQARDAPFWIGLGRLKPGVTLEQARADLALVQSRLAAQFPKTDRGIRVRVERLKSAVVGDVGSSLWLLFGAVTVLLLIACTNIAALMLSRATQREREVAIRCSLGASRAAVIGQMLTEASVLAFAGAGLGLIVAGGALAAFRFLAPNLPRLDEVTIDGRILLYTVACAVVVAVLCGSLPALRSAHGDGSFSRGSTRTQVAGRHSLQWVLIGVQVALSVMLLAGAGLLIRSFEALWRVDTGFDTSRVLAFRIYGNWNESRNYAAVVQRINHTLDTLASLPGAQGSASAMMLPGIPGQNRTEFDVPDGVTTQLASVELRFVSPSYFATLAVPLLNGTMCQRPDAPQAFTKEVMVNRSFAERYFPGRSPVGMTLKPRTGAPPGSFTRISGVVGDARERGIDQEPVPVVYACVSAPSPLPWYFVRTRAEPGALMGAIRLKMKEVEPMRAVYDVKPLEEHVGAAYSEIRLRTVVLSLFAATALSLACLGVYGTLSYIVSLRRREVGLRVALGSPQSTVVSRFLNKALRVVGVGSLAGLLLSFGFTRTLSSMLFGVSPLDGSTLVAVILLVLAIAALAGLIPSLHAARIDPAVALREE